MMTTGTHARRIAHTHLTCHLTYRADLDTERGAGVKPFQNGEAVGEG